MKKLFLSLIAIAAVALSGFAQTSLKEAYSSLSKLPGMETKDASKVQLAQSESIDNLQTSAVSAQSGNVQDYRDNFIYMMENLPVRKMVLGANNQRELAAVYAEPIGAGKYNILIITGNTADGIFSASYGQAGKAVIDAIKGSNVTMDAQGLAIITSPDAGSEVFFGMTD